MPVPLWERRHKQLAGAADRAPLSLQVKVASAPVESRCKNSDAEIFAAGCSGPRKKHKYK